jgi:hypothetical protein
VRRILQSIGARRSAARLARVGAKHETNITAGIRARAVSGIRARAGSGVGFSLAVATIYPGVDVAVAAAAADSRVHARITRRPGGVIMTARSTERDRHGERKSTNADR